MATFALHADRFVLPGRVAGSGYLPIVDGRFGFFTSERPDCKVVEAPGSWVAPGLVDSHIHGFYGHATTDLDPEGINLASIELARRGTTSWLPTTFTEPVDAIGNAVEAIADAVDARPADFTGAHIPGIFLEGPFFTQKHVGAQNPDYLIDPSYEVFAEWQRRARGLIRRSALAPERDGSLEYISRLAAEGVATAIGHTDATFGQAMAAVDAGASTFVHTFNGMRGFAHREPGVVGAAMDAPNAYAEVICDGHHVMPDAARALIQAKGWRHVTLITDCLACGGLPNGDYMSGGMPVVMRDGACYLRDGANVGNLAGSVLTLAEAVRNVVEWGLVTTEQAIRMATENPAISNHIDNVCGYILPGRVADLTVFDNDLAVTATYVGGSPVA